MDLPAYLSFLNIPIAIFVIKIAIEAGKWKYLASHIESHCCITTLKCPLGCKGGDSDGKEATAPAR